MFQSIIDLFFPKSCACCENILLKNESVICTVCRDELPITNHHLKLKNEMFMQFFGRLDIEFASSLLYFQKEGMVQKLMHNLKYKGHQEIGSVLGFWYAEDLKKIQSLNSIDFIIPVPIHPKKKKERGYNQVSSFADSLSKSLNIGVLELILFRDKYLKTQSKKNSSEREEVSSEIFRSIDDEKYHNKHFLLVDDIMTTGATLEACGKQLLKIKGAKLSIVCMAMTKLG